MINCEKIHQSLSAYLDNELSVDEIRIIRKHLFSCYSCQDKYDSLKKTRDLLGSLQPISPPDDIWANLLTQMKTENITLNPWQQKWHALLKWKQMLIIPATVAAAVIALILLTNRESNLPTKKQNMAMQRPTVDIQTQVIDHANFNINHPLTDRGISNYNTIDSEVPVYYQNSPTSMRVINTNY